MLFIGELQDGNFRVPWFGTYEGDAVHNDLLSATARRAGVYYPEPMLVSETGHSRLLPPDQPR